MNSVVLVILIILSISLYFNKTMYDENQNLTNTLAIEKSNKLQLTDAIDKQNKYILELKVDYDKNLKEYYDSISNPKVIIKEIKSNECEDIKSILDDVRKLKL